MAEATEPEYYGRQLNLDMPGWYYGTTYYYFLHEVGNKIETWIPYTPYTVAYPELPVEPPLLIYQEQSSKWYEFSPDAEKESNKWLSMMNSVLVSYDG